MLPIANILQPLIDALENVLLFFHDTVGFGWGFSIIALTIVVRAALIPLTWKQIKSMQAMQRVAPHIKELQAKYKDDKQRLQQETMKFYQENKINPFASCLPLVLQMPVFISLFYMLRKDLRHDICPDINPPTVSNPKPCGSTEASQFFFIPDITNTAHGAVLVTLVIMYVGSQLLSSVFMTTTTDRNQRLLMMALPFVFVAFVINFPAGLLVYWITTNLWTVGQGLVVRKLAPPVVAPAGAGAA
jgi:YidC/Oxa1 family membrane protein insertase